MSKIRISVNNQQSLFDVDRDRIVEAARSVLDSQQITAAEISVAIVDDPQIHTLNREHLNHDYPTDVLSFLYESTPQSIDGELIVSTDTARRVGREHSMQEHDELLLYIVHGTLHLLGFDDDTDEAQLEMRALEQQHMSQLGIQLPSESPPSQSEARP